MQCWPRSIQSKFDEGKLLEQSETGDAHSFFWSLFVRQHHLERSVEVCTTFYSFTYFIRLVFVTQKIVSSSFISVSVIYIYITIVDSTLSMKICLLFSLAIATSVIVVSECAEFGQRLRLFSYSSSSSDAPAVITSARLTAPSLVYPPSISFQSNTIKSRLETERESESVKSDCPPAKLIEPCECNEVRHLNTVGLTFSYCLSFFVDFRSALMAKYFTHRSHVDR